MVICQTKNNKENLCPECEKIFKCCDGNCWCEKYLISKKNALLLKTKYDSCLCPQCLKKYES